MYMLIKYDLFWI